ncbi:Rab3 GTPase-activating protein non-catalytic subunit, putative [Hepatocystis sp. ex Piliocolobus tephrosceles]|nr:Rab3 GTPase-activating protein non-catalytic subunit, putative [Hepatocystis sp. ex Piliocolobus tephrosceles]
MKEENDNNGNNGRDDPVKGSIIIEEVLTLETLISILNKIYDKENEYIYKSDINSSNCKLMLFEFRNELTNGKEKNEELVNILFYFKNKNYFFFLIYCLRKKHIVYLKIFNPLINEKESIESFNIIFINDFFPHIIFGLNNGKVLLYNHEGILCMQNKFIDNKIKNIVTEYEQDYILIVYENNIIVNSNIYIIKEALIENSKILPYDYTFSINKNMYINHILLRYDNNNILDIFKKQIYSIYNKEDLVRYIHDNIYTGYDNVHDITYGNNNMYGNVQGCMYGNVYGGMYANTYGNTLNNDNQHINQHSNQHSNQHINQTIDAHYILTSKNMTLSIINIMKQQVPNTFISKKENMNTSEKLSTKINTFIKNIFTKKTDQNNNMHNNASSFTNTNSKGVNVMNTFVNNSINNTNINNKYTGPIEILNSNIIYGFNDANRSILNICICPWNNNLMLALDNLGRIGLYNISTLNILYMWKSYRLAFMSFISKQKSVQNKSNDKSIDTVHVNDSNHCNGNNNNIVDTTINYNKKTNNSDKYNNNISKTNVEHYEHNNDLFFNQFDKGIFFYIKSRSLIEIWDINTLHKIYSVRTYSDPELLKHFVDDCDSSHNIYFFNTNHHVFLLNSNFELFHLKWV